jgi:hypothetical protein
VNWDGTTPSLDWLTNMTNITTSVPINFVINGEIWFYGGITNGLERFLALQQILNNHPDWNISGTKNQFGTIIFFGHSYQDYYQITHKKILAFLFNAGLYFSGEPMDRRQ